MKCPSCEKPINPRSTRCKHCGARLVRQSDKMVRKMTVNAWIAMASGGLLVVLSAILMLNGISLFAGVTFFVGIVLMITGKVMN